MSKKLWFASIPSVMFMTTMFVSSTFAWFTDFAVNSGNRVQSGNLAVGFASSETITDGNLSGTIQDLKLNPNEVFNLGNAAQPGDSQERYLRVRNEGNIAINYEIDFVVNIDSILAEVIDFEIQPLGGSTRTVIGTEIDQDIYMSLQDNIQGEGGLLRVSPDVPQEYEIWRVKMIYTSRADNTYNDENLVFEVDIRLNAWQFNYQESQGSLSSQTTSSSNSDDISQSQESIEESSSSTSINIDDSSLSTIEPNFINQNNFAGETSEKDQTFRRSGMTYYSGNSVILVNNGEAQVGGFFTRNRLTMSDSSLAGFSTYFEMYQGGGKNSMNGFSGFGDGFTFVIARDYNVLGASGGAIGYGGIPNSMAILFDTFDNGGQPPMCVSLGVNGSQGGCSYIGGYNGVTWRVWVDYSRVSKTMELRMNSINSTRPANPTRSFTNLSFDNVGNEFYAGFTSSTGGAVQNTILSKWYLNNSYLVNGVVPSAS